VPKLHRQAELIDRRQPAFDRRLRINDLADIGAIAKLIGNQFAVGPRFTNTNAGWHRFKV
jgi:hypothetical protein